MCTCMTSIAHLLNAKTEKAMPPFLFHSHTQHTARTTDPRFWTASPSLPQAQLDQEGVEILVDEYKQEGFAVGAAAGTGTGRLLHLFG